jgi:signal transduction histidine kinase
MSHPEAAPRPPEPNSEPHWSSQPASPTRWDQHERDAEAGAAWLESEERSRGESYELAPLPLLTLDARGSIRQANRAAGELFRLRIPELVGRSLLDLIEAESRARVWQALAAARMDLPAACHVLQARLLVGSTPVELTLRGSPHNRGIIHASILDSSQHERDVHEREALEHAIESKERVLAMLSHELRTPLTPALAMAAKLSHSDALSSELSRSFELIERNLREEARLIDDLLDATAIGHGLLRVQRRPVDVHALLAESVEAARLLTEKKQLELDFAPGASAFRANADPLRLKQVFSNLLTNAIKYTPAGGHIHVRTRDGDGGRLTIEFQDSGLGFTEADSARLFAAFDQLPQPGRPRGGLGLGLAICRALLELQDGEISATSPGPGRGACFVVELPAKP